MYPSSPVSTRAAQYLYNLLAIPVAAGILYPRFGITLRPEVSALLMSLSSIIVATNAVLLKRVEKDLVDI